MLFALSKDRTNPNTPFLLPSLLQYVVMVSITIVHGYQCKDKKESDVEMLFTGLQTLKQAPCRNAGQWSLAMKQAVTHSNLCWQRLLCGSITLLVSLLFKPVTTDQHPYMQLISVLCKHVSSIPTSLSFFFKFFILCLSSFQLNNSVPTYAVSLLEVGGA